MTRCTCLWSLNRQERLLPDPECPSPRHLDDPPSIPPQPSHANGQVASQDGVPGGH